MVEEEEEEVEALTLSATQSVGHPLAVNIELNILNLL